MTSPTAIIDAPAHRGGIPLFAEPFRFIQPSLPDLEAVLEDYRHAYATGLITNGAMVRRFEDAVAERLGVRHCVACSSCTSGLMIVLQALGLTGEVLLPSFTFFATGHALLWNRLRPVFVDIDPATWTIDPAAAERCVTPATSAIVGVHLYGNPCDVDAVSEVAKRHRLKLIFDAAHAFGSRCQGRPVGQFGDAEIFSLTPTKILISGEGGLITTGDPVLARRLRAARNYGDEGSGECEFAGINARMSEFHAALGLSGIPVVDRKVQRHNRIAAIYRESLGDLPGIRCQEVKPGNLSTFKDFSIHITASDFGLSRDELREVLKSENIETRRYFYPPLHRQKIYAKYVSRKASLGVTEHVSNGILSLPIAEGLSDDTVRRIAHAIRRAYLFGSETR